MAGEFLAAPASPEGKMWVSGHARKFGVVEHKIVPHGQKIH